MRVVMVCCAVLGPVVSFWSPGHADAKVSGTVYVFDGDTAVVPGATVSFLRSDGQSVKVTTNQLGEYEVLLDPEYDYTMAVAGQQLCAMHRPPFRALRGSALKFDFRTTICGIIDGVFVRGSDSKPHDDRFLYRQYYRSAYDSHAPYWFFEESVALGDGDYPWVVVAFGERDEDQHGVSYGPFRIPPNIMKLAKYRLPVTIRFDTYTVQANGVKLDQKTRILRAEGGVLIADGLNDQPPEATCVLFDLSRKEPRPAQCKD
jgi:hypothetical protein